MDVSWKERLSGEFTKPYFKQLVEFVREERQKHVVFPFAECVSLIRDLHAHPLQVDGKTPEVLQAEILDLDKRTLTATLLAIVCLLVLFVIALLHRSVSVAREQARNAASVPPPGGQETEAQKVARVDKVQKDLARKELYLLLLLCNFLGTVVLIGVLSQLRGAP